MSDDVSRLSKTVRATASTLVTGSYAEINNHLHSAMTDMARTPGFQKRLFSFSNRRTPSELVKSTLHSKQEIKFHALTSIPDEMLRDIPESSSQYSLFQGFEASKEEAPSDLKLLEDSSSPAKSVDNLNHRLDLLEIRKDLAANEIQEIDQRIEHLQNMRQIVFDRIAKLEQEEFQLENELRQMDAAAAQAEAEMKLRDDTAPAAADKKEDIPLAPESEQPGEVDDDGNEGMGLMSQSIYGKLQTSKLRTRARRRKTMPTLQQFYQPGKNIRTIQGHKDSVTAMDFDIPFGTMVTASLDDSVLVWDLSRGQVTNELNGHKASVKALQIEDNYVVTGSADATLKLWDISDEGAEELDSYEAHLGEVTALHFSDNTLVSGSADKTIRQWDMNTGKCVQTLDVVWAAAQTTMFDDSRWRKPVGGQGDFVGALQSYDAALATGTADGIVRLWDLRSGQVHRSLVGHTGPVTCLQFDEYHLATGSMDRSVRIWDLRTGSIFDAFAYENPITALQFDARRVVSATGESTVKIYDREVEKHWSCGPGEEGDNSISINRVRYREGYIVEGRQDGNIGVWAC